MSNSNRESANKQVLGDKKYKDRIARDNNKSSDLPFTFIKTSKTKQQPRDCYLVCDLCFALNSTSKITQGKSCSSCTSYISRHKSNYFTSYDDALEFIKTVS